MTLRIVVDELDKVYNRCKETVKGFAGHLSLVTLAGITSLSVMGYNALSEDRITVKVTCREYNQKPVITRYNKEIDKMLYANFRCIV